MEVKIFRTNAQVDWTLHTTVTVLYMSEVLALLY